MAVVSVNKLRGGELVAWRYWAASPKIHSGMNEPFLHDAIAFMRENRLMALGYADERLTKHPDTWPKFEAATGYPPLVYWFAHRMKKGDLVVLGRNRGWIEAYGYLKDDRLRYIDKKHPLNARVERLQKQSGRIYDSIGRNGAFESLRNYREVEEWIPFDGPPRNTHGQLDGNYRATISAVTMKHGLHWLGQADAPEHFSKAKQTPGRTRKGRKSSKPGPFAGPNLSDLTESAVKEALLHYELHRRDELPTDDPAKAPFVIKYDGKLYQPWPVIVQATTDEFRQKFPYEPPRSPVCQRLLALGFPVVRHPKASS
ncbi:MAG: hypothetical protein IPK87_00785 [Planctomycetes bacterium]|nr:hypothetical protein [Planctomycetota bacterium]